jgi:mono/diheme cytochrome c family protein
MSRAARRVWPALAALAACGGAQATVDRALQRMYDQPKAQAYGASDVFPNGAVLRPPPAGTVAREDVADPTVGLGLDSAGKAVTQVPIQVTPALLARGRKRFEIACAACHGPGGFGGSIVAENWLPPRPPSLRTGVAAQLPAGMVYQVISNGFGRMPAYAGDLTVPDRWAIVAYLLTQRGRPPADSTERADSARAEQLRVLDSTLADTARADTTS